MGTKRKLLLFTLVIVLVSVAVAMVASAMLIQHQITRQQTDRLVNALASVKRQISDDMPVIEASLSAFKTDVASQPLQEVGPGTTVTDEDMIGMLRYYPEIRDYLFQFGRSADLANFAVYLPSRRDQMVAPVSKSTAYLYVQYVSALDGLIVGGTERVRLTARNYFERDRVDRQALFPERLDDVPPPSLARFEGGPGVTAALPFRNGGYLVLQRRWDFSLATEEKDLGAVIGIYDKAGQRIDGAGAAASISPRSVAGSNELVTMFNDRGEAHNGLIAPIVHAGVLLGYVSVSISKALAQRSIYEVAGLAIAIGMVIMAFAVIFALYLVSSFTRPIFQMMNDCRIIAGGDLDHRIDTSRTDEFGVLARAFADMQRTVGDQVHVINRANTELAQHRDHLQQAVDRLRETEAQLNSAFESFSDGFMLFDAEDRFVVANEAYIKVHAGAADLLKPGVKMEDLVRRLANEGFYGNSAEEAEALVRERLEIYRSGRPFEYRMDDGKWFEITTYPTIDGGVALVRSDITRRKQAEAERSLALEQAKRANRAKSEFLATISHELRTPLNAILGFSEIIARHVLGPSAADKYREYAGDIHSSAVHLLELVNDVLDISAIEAGKMRLNPVEFSLATIVDECAMAVEPALTAKEVRVERRVVEGLPHIFADRRAVKQVLLNLLSNAAKHTPTGGQVSVSAEAINGQFVIRVVDTGCGISADMLPDITAPFAKGITDPYKAAEGWGLGLAISKSLVELHHGTLEIESEVGKGTRVSVYLPDAGLAV